MSKNKKVEAAAVVGLTKASDIPNILEVLDKKLSSLQHISETPFKTSGEVQGFPTNIKNETKIENLIAMGASIHTRRDVYNNYATKQLGRKSFPAFTIGGNSVEDVDADILLRISVIEHKETFDKLTAYKEKISKFMSEEQQQAMLVKDMAGFLSTLS